MVLSDLLKAVAVGSANDAAVALAEHIAGSEEAFAVLMNKRAAELGMKDTHFVNASGLDADGHISTAADVAKNGLRAFKARCHKKLHHNLDRHPSKRQNAACQHQQAHKILRGSHRPQNRNHRQGGLLRHRLGKKERHRACGGHSRRPDKRFAIHRRKGAAQLRLCRISRPPFPKSGEEALLEVPVRGGQKSYVKLEGAKNNRLLTEKGRGGDIEVKIELDRPSTLPSQRVGYWDTRYFPLTARRL